MLPVYKFGQAGKWTLFYICAYSQSRKRNMHALKNLKKKKIMKKTKSSVLNLSGVVELMELVMYTK